MQRIRPDAVALREKGMCGCVHRSVASRPLWIRAKEIRHPPGLERTVACKSVGDPQPPKDPAGIDSAKVRGGGSKSDRKLHPDAFYVVERSKRNPIVERHE